MKARVASLKLKGIVDIWWEDLRNFKGIREKELLWRNFEEYFHVKHMSKIYHGNKVKEFHEHNLG